MAFSQHTVPKHGDWIKLQYWTNTATKYMKICKYLEKGIASCKMSFFDIRVFEQPGQVYPPCCSPGCKYSSVQAELICWPPNCESRASLCNPAPLCLPGRWHFLQTQADGGDPGWRNHMWSIWLRVSSVQEPYTVYTRTGPGQVSGLFFLKNSSFGGTLRASVPDGCKLWDRRPLSHLAMWWETEWKRVLGVTIVVKHFGC